MSNIRYEYKVKGKSLRQIAKETGYDVGTVRKYVNMENFSPVAPPTRTRSSKSDEYREVVKLWLINDEKAPRKQRHTARRVYDRLVDEWGKKGKTIDVSERTIRNLVADIKKEIGQAKEASLPLLHPAGGAQGDFGETEFIENGITYTGHHFCLTFPHSDGKFAQLFKGENLECLEQGLTDIFRAIGGTPHTVWLDNMSTAVKAIKAYGEREVTEGFARLQCHYGFDSNFCNPSSGHEKGSVENYVGYSRRNYFVPVPQFDNLEEYNKQLLEECIKDLDRMHYKCNRNVKDLFAEDKEAFIPLPTEEYDCCKYLWVKTNAYGMATFDKNRYSTSGELPNSKVLLKIKAHNVIVLDEKHTEIVTHPRLYGKGQESMIWTPYLSVMAKRPNALKYTGFFESLDQCTKAFLNTQDLPSKKAILSEFTKFCDTHGLHKSLLGLSEAVKLGPRDADGLISAFHFAMNIPGANPKNRVPENLPKTEEYPLSLNEYNKFMEGATDV